MLMEQKHIDEMEEDSFLGEELVEDEEYPILKVNSKKDKKTIVAPVTAPKPKVVTPIIPKKEEEIYIVEY